MSPTCVMDSVAANLHIFGALLLNYFIYYVGQLVESAGDLLFAATYDQILLEIQDTIKPSEKAPLSGAPARRVKIPPYKHYRVQHRNEQPNHTGHQSANETINHVELGALGAADNHPVADSSYSTIDLESGVTSDGARDISTSDDNASDSNGDSNSGGIGNRHGRGRFQDFIIGILFLFMAIIAQFGPGLMQLAGSTQKHDLKLLLWGINLAAAGCFLSSSCGLLGVVMCMVDCPRISSDSLQKVQKVSLVTASASMMAAMVMVFIFIPLSMG